MSKATVILVLIAAVVAGPPGAAAAQPTDSDADGILDEHEKVLGTDPAHAERLRRVLEDGVESEGRRKQKGYDATKDFTTVELCHVAQDRYLWRVTLAARPRLADTVLHLYVNADADPKTGRKGSPRAAYLGTEYMLSVVGGRGWSSWFDADGTQTSGPPVSFAVQGNAVLISADVNLSRNERGIRCGLYVLCHTTTRPGRPAVMSDSSRKRLIEGIPVSARKKIMRPRDYKASHGVAATFGLDVIRSVLRDKGVTVVPPGKLGRDGFEVDEFTSHRWPHVKLVRAGGKVWTKVPAAGEYHVGFLMYDRERYTERVVFRIDGELCGVAVANQDNNRTWLYWLRQRRRFRGGERIELVAAGQGGTHGICNILLLPRTPEIRKIEHRVENLVAVPSADRPGRAIISWTTTWPCPTRFEYGKDTTYGKTAQAEGRCLVHRVVLDGLEPGREYHGRAVGTARDGSAYHGEDFRFTTAGRTAAGGETKDLAPIPLTVRNDHPFAADRWPITTGIPIPRGKLPSAKGLIVSSRHMEIPSQVRVTGRWPDGSVKWLLVTFLARAPAKGTSQYQLVSAKRFAGYRQGAGPKPLSVQRGPAGVTIRTGAASSKSPDALRFRIDRRGRIVDVRRPGGPALVPKGACASLATDAKGTALSAEKADAQVTVEEEGDVRAVVKVVSHLVDAEGTKRLRIEKRVEAYQGLAMIRVRHTFVVLGREEFTQLKDLSYRVAVPTAGAKKSWQVPLAKGKALRLDGAGAAAFQRFDNEFVHGAGTRQTPVKGRIVGAIHTGGPDGCAVAVRDFWQNYPKAFSVRPDGLHVGLCPPFEPGLYDEKRFPFEREGHHLYYHLRGGWHRLKQGMAKTHDILLCFEPPERREKLCALFQRPPPAAAPPKWYCDSKAFYDVAPRDPVRFGLYEEAIERNLKAYVARRERQRDYGMLNYGDWYGERGSNWGNVEYDTQFAFFLEYIRSGNPRALYLGEATELHNRDIDTVQWSPDPTRIGGVYVHQMCHVGGYYTKGVPGTLGFPRGGYTVSHAWVEGHFAHYFLTGDRRSYETGCAITDYFIRKQLGRPYDFLTTRTPGWHLIMLAAAYHATGDPYYLNAAKVVVERVLETQDGKRPLPAYQAAGRKPYQEGGWSRMMRPGHCRCTPRHRGNAGFMVAVLLSGLKYYHDVTGDPRVKGAIIRGAHYLLDETYSDKVKGFRYTSCPKTRYSPGASPLMAEGVARAYLWTKDERFRRMLTESLPLRARGSGYGKGFSMHYRCGPRLLADLAAAGIPLAKPPETKR